MTVRAVDLARIVRGIEDPYEVERFICHVAWCVESVSHAHHVMARGPMGGAYDWLELTDGFTIGNLVGLCTQHHNDVHSHKAAIRLAGRAWEFDGDGCKGLLNPRAPVRTLTGGETVALTGHPGSPDAEGQLEATVAGGSSPPVSVPPGQDCPKCGRQMPHDKKKDSPKRGQVNITMALDAKDEFVEIYKAAGEHLDCYKEPFWRYRVALSALVLILQDPHPDRRVA